MTIATKILIGLIVLMVGGILAIIFALPALGLWIKERKDEEQIQRS